MRHTSAQTQRALTHINAPNWKGCVLAMCCTLAACTGAPTTSTKPTTSPMVLDDVAKRSNAHVVELAQVIGPRNDDHPQAYIQAQKYIQRTLSAHLTSTPNAHLELHPVKTHKGTWQNIELTLKGTQPDLPAVVLGAHYDSCQTTPGADDNASGVASLLEVHRWLSAQKQPTRTIRLVFFANEEPPHFQNKSMGSVHYAAMAKARGDEILAMFSLEMLGYYKTEPGTQKYPNVLRLFYPSTGNFLAFVSSWDYDDITDDSVALFTANSRLPVISYAGIAMRGTDYSDHWSFWRQGYPGIMITDTSSLRTPHYHKLTDTPETLDYTRMSWAIEGIGHMAYALAMRPKAEVKKAK